METSSVVIIPNPTPTTKLTRPSKPSINIKYSSSINKVTENTNNEHTQQLSEDNYIKNIEITNHEILFDKVINKYLIEINNDINNLDLNITLNDEYSTFAITGNENFIPGKNEIIITVKSQKGETRDYIIEVNKDDDAIVKTEEENIITKEEVIKEKQTKTKINYKKIVYILTLITLIIVVIVLIYKLLTKED